jgi:flagellum-specific peptidoglycan hydrolase FlgJ
MFQKVSRLFLLQVLFVQLVVAQKTTLKYIDRFLPVAMELSTEFQIPVSIILGVSILESGSGTSANCKDLNNYFGVKGKNHLKKRKTKYKQYQKPEDSFRDFCNIISRKKFYSKLQHSGDYKRWLNEMNKAQYAGAGVSWVKAIDKIIRAYKLNVHDAK